MLVFRAFLSATCVVLFSGVKSCNASDLLPERADPTDVEVDGRFKVRGFLTWRQGLTLNDAINAAGGTTEYVAFIDIIGPELFPADPLATEFRRVHIAEIESDQELLHLPITPGGKVRAVAAYPAVTDPQPLVAAITKVQEIIADARRRDSNGRETLKHYRLQNYADNARSHVDFVVSQWRMARRVADDRTEAERLGIRAVWRLADVSGALVMIGEYLASENPPVPKAELHSAIAAAQTEIDRYRDAIEAGFP